MQNATGDRAATEFGHPNEACHAVVADLVRLIENVQAILRLIEQANAPEISSGLAESADIIVLDDVAPRFLKAIAALHACDANLGIALHSLLDSPTRPHGAGAYALSPSRF